MERKVKMCADSTCDLSDELIEVMANNPKICKHLHLPIQSGSTEILKKMNRRYTKEDYLALVERIKAEIPGISLTTDIMIGFPGETEEDFLETIDVVNRVKFDQAYTFIYSRRTGTPAAEADNQIPNDVAKDRFNRLLECVNSNSYEQIKRFEGQVKSVLVEDINSQDKSLVTGRTDENITVHFDGDCELIGNIVDVQLKECKGFYYIGERIK